MDETLEEATTADGQKGSEERKIGEAVITDQIGKGYSWITVNPSNLEQSQLAGDMMRAVHTDDLVTGLGLGACSDVLSVDVDPR